MDDKYSVSERTRLRNIIPLLAALWATLVGAYLYYASTYDMSVVYFGPGMSRFEMMKNRVIAYGSLLGPGSEIGLTIPIFLALLPLAVQKHRRGALLVAGALTIGVCLLWPLSIGGLYFPSGVLLLLAAGATEAEPAHAI